MRSLWLRMCVSLSFSPIFWVISWTGTNLSHFAFYMAKVTRPSGLEAHERCHTGAKRTSFPKFSSRHFDFEVFVWPALSAISIQVPYWKLSPSIQCVFKPQTSHDCEFYLSPALQYSEIALIFVYSTPKVHPGVNFDHVSVHELPFLVYDESHNPPLFWRERGAPVMDTSIDIALSYLRESNFGRY